MKSNVSVAAQQGVYFNQQQNPQQQSQPNQAGQGGNTNNSTLNTNPQNPQQQNLGNGQGNFVYFLYIYTFFNNKYKKYSFFVDSYSMSQSQSINFNQQQQQRQRQAQNNPGAGNNVGIGGAGAGQPGVVPPGANMMNPQGNGPSVNTANQLGGNINMAGPMGPGNQIPPNTAMNQNQSMMMQGGGPIGGMTAKYQQMIRAQAMQQQHMGPGPNGMGGSRPPPPEYKASQAQLMQAQMMHQGGGAGGRFANAAAMRRMAQQPIPPSGEFFLNFSFVFILKLF